MRGTFRGLLATLLLAGLTAASAAAAAPPAPTWVATIGHPAHAAMYPSGLDVDSNGNVYVADTGNDQVAAYNASGKQLWRVGVRGSKALGRFNNPRDIAYLAGKLYVADLGYNRVQVLNASTGQAISAWPTRFTSVLGISAGVDGNGNPVILTSDDQQNKVSEYTPSGTLVRAISPPVGSGNGQLNAPRDADTDSSGNIYVADYNNDRIAKFGPTGTWIKNWGSHGSAHGQFLRPYGVAVDASNNIYVADSDNERIQKFSSQGGYLALYGSKGTGNGQFQQLRRVAVGPGASPQVYGADLWGNHIDRFSQAGAFQQRFGGAHAALGGFNEPSGISLDSSSIYVADSVNQRVQRFDLQQRLPGILGQPRLGSERPQRLQLGARPHLQLHDQHGLGCGHEEQPHHGVLACRHPHGQGVRRDRIGHRTAALALRRGIGRQGSDRGRHMERPRRALEHDHAHVHLDGKRLRLPEGRGGAGVDRLRGGLERAPDR